MRKHSGKWNKLTHQKDSYSLMSMNSGKCKPECSLKFLSWWTHIRYFISFVEHKVFSSLDNSSSLVSLRQINLQKGRWSMLLGLYIIKKSLGWPYFKMNTEKTFSSTEGLNIPTQSLQISFSSQPPPSVKCPCRPEQVLCPPCKGGTGDPQGTHSSWSRDPRKVHWKR